MYFISGLWRGVKLFLAGLGILASGAVIIYGAVTGGTVFVVGGVICFIPSAFLVFDSSKVLQDIKNAITKFNGDLDKFKQENIKLQEEMDNFEQENKNLAQNVDKFVEENDQLAQLLQETNDKIETLENLQTEISKENEKLQKASSKLEHENHFYAIKNKELSESVVHLNVMQEEFKQENQNLKDLVQKTTEKINSLHQIEQEYETENDKLRNQVEQLRKLYASAKELVKDLMKATDLFTEYQSSFESNMGHMDETAENLENNVGILSNLMNKLNAKLLREKFDVIDLDKDGNIDQTELQTFVNSHNGENN